MTVGEDKVIPEDFDRLSDSNYHVGLSSAHIAQALRSDKVALIKAVPEDAIDELIRNVADEFQLTNGLELQAGFAEMYGHREKLSKYFMTVNKRADFQCTQPHSEGSSFQNIQLVSFYCYENSTDGGVTTLFNTSSASDFAWEKIRERVTRGILSESQNLTPAVKAEARMRYQIDLPDDLIDDNDIVLKRGPSEIPGLALADVLAKSKKTFSKISERKHFAYWSSISRFDSDSLVEFRQLLNSLDLYKRPADATQTFDDGLVDKGLWSSKTRYSDLFKNRLFLKLQPGDFIVLNNLTWCHGVSNWTPNSGTRKVGAALA